MRQVVGDRAASALMRQGAYETLESQLGHNNAAVRLRVVTALSQRGLETLTAKWLACSRDEDPLVRQQVIHTIGQLEPNTRARAQDCGLILKQPHKTHAVTLVAKPSAC